MYSLVLPGRLAAGACKYIVIVMLNISLDGCKAPESLFISQLWHALLSDERDGRLGTRGSVDIAPTDIVSGGDARGSQQKNFQSQAQQP